MSAAKVNKSRIIRGIRNVTLSILILAILLVGGGVAYTWYMGRQPIKETAMATDPLEPSVRPPIIKAPQPAPNAKVSASVQTITSPVPPGSNASITIKTNPAANCTIKVIYDNSESKDSGLGSKTADEYGMVSWTWTVDPTVPTGKWPVKVACANEEKSAVVQGDLKVEK